MLLCDSAQEMGGKLYVLGGGWSILNMPPGAPVNMALAVKIGVPWDQTNRRMVIRIALMTEDGEQFEAPGAGPVEVSTQVEVGRPPGLKPGTDIDLPMAFAFNGLVLEPGGYRWELEINGGQEAKTAFRVLDPQRGGMP